MPHAPRQSCVSPLRPAANSLTRPGRLSVGACLSCSGQWHLGLRKLARDRRGSTSGLPIPVKI